MSEGGGGGLVCEVCGGTRFSLELGQMVCLACGTQSQQYTEAYLDTEWTESLLAAGASAARRGIINEPRVVDPEKRLGRTLTLNGALRVLLRAHVDAMRAQDGPVAAPREFAGVVDAIAEAWFALQPLQSRVIGPRDFRRRRAKLLQETLRQMREDNDFGVDDDDDDEEEEEEEEEEDNVDETLPAAVEVEEEEEIAPPPRRKRKRRLRTVKEANRVKTRRLILDSGLRKHQRRRKITVPCPSSLTRMLRRGCVSKTPKNIPSMLRRGALLPLAFCMLGVVWLHLPYGPADFVRMAASGALPTISAWSLLPRTSAYRVLLRVRSPLTVPALLNVAEGVAQELAFELPRRNIEGEIGRIVSGLRLPRFVSDKARQVWAALPRFSLVSDMLLAAVVVVALKLVFRRGWTTGTADGERSFLRTWVEAWSVHHPEQTPWLETDDVASLGPVAESRYVSFCNEHVFPAAPKRPELSMVLSTLRTLRESLIDPAELAPDPFIVADQLAEEEEEEQRGVSSAAPNKSFMLPHLSIPRLERYSLSSLTEEWARKDERLASLADIAAGVRRVPMLYDATVAVCAAFVHVPVQRLHVAISRIEIALTQDDRTHHKKKMRTQRRSTTRKLAIEEQSQQFPRVPAKERSAPIKVENKIKHLRRLLSQSRAIDLLLSQDPAAKRKKKES